MNKLLKCFIHYKLYVSGLMAIFFIIIVKVKENTNDIMQYYQHSSTFTNSIVALKLIFLVIWATTTILLIVQTAYSDKTGKRNLIKDVINYKLSPLELLTFFKNSDLHRLNIEEYPICRWDECEGVILGQCDGHVIYRSSNERGGEGCNIGIFSIPGGGKTTSTIIPSALRFGGSVLAIDIKGDIYNATKGKRRIKIFAPNDASISEHFNPLAGVEKMNLTVRRSFLKQMSQILIPDEKDGKYFVDTARTYFMGISLFLIKEKGAISLPELSKTILKGNAKGWVIKIMESDCAEAQQYTNSLHGSNEKNINGAYGQLCEAMRAFIDGALCEILEDNGKCISPETLEEGWDIYIEIPQDMIPIYSPITSLLIQSFMLAFMSRPDRSFGEISRGILFMLDELPQLRFDYETLISGLTTLRSKGVSIMYASQSIALLAKKYGEHGANSIIDTTSFFAIMTVQAPDSREYFSKLFGKKKIFEKSMNLGDGEYGRTSSSISIHEKSVPVIDADEFGNLDKNVAIYIRGKYIIADKTSYFN